MRRSIDWKTFPLCFLGFGCLYAWGYLLWETTVLSTCSISEGQPDLSWLASAVVVPAALFGCTLWGRKRELDRLWAPYVAAPALAALGTLLSVVYQWIPSALLAQTVAVVSGLGTGLASALFVVLWSLAFSRLNTETLELAIPLSFAVSALCALVAPSLPLAPALVVALLLVAGCALCLARAREQLESGRIGRQYLLEADASQGRPAEPVVAIARMLLYGVAAWALCSLAPSLATSSHGPSAYPVDLVSFLGFLLAIAYTLAIIRYAIRVDFQALASMTLAPFVLSLALYAAQAPWAQFVAGVLNVAMGACFEAVLLLYFVRAAQMRATAPSRTFWLSLGCGAGYLGVLVGQLISVAFVRSGLPFDGSAAYTALALVCIYAFAMLLIPQRRPYEAPEAPADASRREPSVDADAPSPSPSRKEPGAPSNLDATDQACARIAQEYQLSPREAEICSLLARGRSQTYIRDALFLSKNTVATHARHLYAKLGVHSKQELIDLVEKHL